MLAAFAVEVENSVHAIPAAKRDAGSHRMRAHLSSVPDGLRNVSDERTGFRADLTALNAEPAIDAVRPVSMRSRKDCDGTTRTYANSELRAPLDEHIADSAQRMRPIRIPVRVAPWEVRRAGDGDLTFQQFVIRLEFFVGDG